MPENAPTPLVDETQAVSPAAHAAPLPPWAGWSWLLAMPLLGALVWLSLPAFSGRIWVMGDLLGFHLPFRYFYQECLHQGQNFLWCPWVGAGVDLHGEGQNGMLHPWHLLLYASLPFHWAFQVDLLTGILVGASGTVALLRRWGASWAAAWAGVPVIALAGFGMIHLIHPNMVVVIVCCDPDDKTAPTTVIPEMALDPDINGV